MLPENTYTIEQFIEEAGGGFNISYDSFCLSQDINEDISVISFNVLNDYIDELKSIAVTITLSDKEYNRYVYKPKLLAYDVYGSTELYFIIMYLNNICDVKQFNIKKIKMLRKEALDLFISSVYNAEKENLKNNRGEM